MRKDNTRINDEITSLTVRLVGKNVENNVIKLSDALHLAEVMGLDLIEINSQANPPILKIGNYEKIQYEAKKNAKKNAKSRQEIKEIQLSANIAEHDLQTKVNNAKKFIEKGNNVRVVLTLRGREMTRQEENQKSILEFITMMEDVAAPMSLPKKVGNKTLVILKQK